MVLQGFIAVARVLGAVEEGGRVQPGPWTGKRRTPRQLAAVVPAVCRLLPAMGEAVTVRAGSQAGRSGGCWGSGLSQPRSFGRGVFGFQTP